MARVCITVRLVQSSLSMYPLRLAEWHTAPLGTHGDISKKVEAAVEDDDDGYESSVEGLDDFEDILVSPPSMALCYQGGASTLSPSVLPHEHTLAYHLSGVLSAQEPPACWQRLAHCRGEGFWH